MTPTPPTLIPTSPGGGYSASASAAQEYERAYGHGYISGMRACTPAQTQIVGKSDSTDQLFHRFLLGLAVGVLGGLMFGLFLGMFLAQALKP